MIFGRGFLRDGIGRFYGEIFEVCKEGSGYVITYLFWYPYWGIIDSKSEEIKE
jgi:hypothetical protein